MYYSSIPSCGFKTGRYVKSQEGQLLPRHSLDLLSSFLINSKIIKLVCPVLLSFG